MSMSGKTNLLSMDRAQMEAYFTELGEQAFRAKQVFKWIYHALETDFNAMHNLSKVLRERLLDSACIVLPTLERTQISTDGTRKWLMRLHDDNAVEVVFIPDQKRATLCISSQVGCSLNCTFCATARQGFNRNLSSGEIVGQVWLAWQILSQESEKLLAGTETSGKTSRPISNIVLMGMGEPLLNYAEVTKAIRILLDDFAFGLSRRRITLSTAGIVSGINQLAEDLPVSLAVSLHATDDDLRNELVPLNKKYPIAVLLQACKQYAKGRARVTFEYLMLAGINDSDKQAHELAKLLADVPAKVNLIPFNPVEDVPYQCSSVRRVNAFRDILMQYDIVTVTRKTRGGDIDAACGQLVGKVDDRTKRSQRLKTSIKVQLDAA